MIQLENRQLCENCFAQIKSEPCPVCGFSKAGYVPRVGVLPVGSILMGKYIIGQLIGQGGFGITYRAYDIKRHELVVIKEYFPSSLSARLSNGLSVAATTAENSEIFRSGIGKFYEEASLVSKFNGDPNIVNVYEFFYENDTAYFSMEYLEGVSLKNYVQERGVLSPEQALYVLHEVTNALITAHGANVLHRDISPDNIMLCSNGRVKLIDFGAARQVIADNPKSMSVILKQGFAPLEQYQKRGNQGPWTDIYSLGATVYYSMTGDFLDDPMSRLDYDADFTSNKYDIEGQFWQVIERAVRLKIVERYQSAYELKEDLKNIKYKPVPIFGRAAAAPAPAPVPPMQGAPQGMPQGNVQGNPQGNPQGNMPPMQGAPQGNVQGNVQGNPQGNPQGNMPPMQGAPQGMPQAKAPASAPIAQTEAFDGGNGMGGVYEPYKPQPAKKRFNIKIPIIAGSVLFVIITAIIVAVAVNIGKNNSWGGGEYVDYQVQIGSKFYDGNIEEIDLTGQGLTNSDIANLKELKRVKILLMNDNRLTDLSVLNEMPWIEGVWFNNNNVSDISFVRNIKKLKYISFANNRVTDLSPLQGTTSLLEFWADENGFTDLSPIKENKGMTCIGISGNPLDGGDITALAGMSKLTVIVACNCNLNSLYPLRACKKLEALYLNGNIINDVSPLKNSKSIKTLSIKDNKVWNRNDYIESFRGLVIVDDGSIDVSSSRDNGEYFIFDSEAEAQDWAKSMKLGGNVDYTYTYRN